jgi:HSP20 family protein
VLSAPAFAFLGSVSEKLHTVRQQPQAREGRFEIILDLGDLPSGFRAFQDTVNRLLSEPSSGRPWTPAVDILETDNELMIKADLPRVDLQDIQVETENGTLTLKGERKFDNKEKAQGYHRIERSFGAFVRYFSLPETVEPEKVTAEYKNGVLTVSLANKELAKPRCIKVEVH